MTSAQNWFLSNRMLKERLTCRTVLGRQGGRPCKKLICWSCVNTLSRLSRQLQTSSRVEGGKVNTKGNSYWFVWRMHLVIANAEKPDFLLKTKDSCSPTIARGGQHWALITYWPWPRKMSKAVCNDLWCWKSFTFPMKNQWFLKPW